MLTNEEVQLLEQVGCKVVINGVFDYNYNTDVFIQIPNGNVLAEYDTLDQIPVLLNGTNFLLRNTAMPYDSGFGIDTLQVDGGAVTHKDTAMTDGQLIAWFGWIVIAIIGVLFTTCVYWWTHPQQPKPPCGTESQITDVTDCLKIITLPNCDSRAYNACTDEWAEPAWHEYIPPEPPWEWLKWAVYGIAAIGGLYLAVKLIPILTKPKERPPPREKYYVREV